MKLVKTVKCKLQVTPEDGKTIQETLDRYAQACNDALDVALEHHITNKITLHQRLYYVLKERYSLTANYVVRCFARVVSAIKSAKAQGRKPRRFRPTSLDLDKDLFRLIEIGDGEEFWISLSTVHGRCKIKLHIGNYQRGLLKGQKPTSATLSYNKRREQFYINIVLEKPMPAPNPTGRKGKIVGVDLGIVNLAATSTGMKFSGKEAMHVRRRFATKRANLQSKGTPSTKRVLKRLSGRESRWMRDLNHAISHKIVDNLKPGDVIVMENLTHIRERIKVRKKQRGLFHSWAFGQLQNFIKYKALERGIAVEYVDPRGTSKTCSRCGHRSSRNGHRFSCSACGHRAHADFNAAHNLRRAFSSFAPADGLLSTSPKATPSGSCKLPV
ncbi:MAG: RNA-guided endonuclease InsQ/TnpB family protein [Candidatus Binatia bacterium]